MRNSTTFVGMDVHKRNIQVAMLLPGQIEPVCWELANEPAAVRRMIKKVASGAQGTIRYCYEAGPCGFALQRQMRKEGEDCIVVAPSLIPYKPGERIKTDRRDGRKLAKYFRSGDLTEVRPPSPEEEAVRDLSRCREDAREDLQRARHRIAKLLLRHGITWKNGRAWTEAHLKWLRQVRFEQEADQVTFGDYLLGMEQILTRLRELEARLGEWALREPYRGPVGWLRCFRGIDTITAMTLVAELHDFRRFGSPRQLMAYLGLVPSEHSSGDSRRRGSITKTGNTHVRRALIEAAWHQRHVYRIGEALRKRREGQPGWVIAIADKAGQRLSRRYLKLLLSGKEAPKVAAAIARELAGFVWAVMQGPLEAGPPPAALRRARGARA